MEICGRCYDEVDVVYEANCTEKPEALKEAPLGMYQMNRAICGQVNQKICSRY